MTKKNIGKRKRNKTVLIILFTIFIIATAFFLWNNRPTKARITLDFSIFPGETTKGVTFAVYTPFLTLNEIKEVSKAAKEFNIPLTVFFIAHNETKLDDALRNEASVNISSLKQALGEANYSIQDAGYINTPYADLPYQQQEDLLKLSRVAYRNQGKTVDGFLPPSFSYSYDTILAAENMKYDYIIIPSSNESVPLHPRAAFGGKMKILIIPYRKEPGEGLNLIFLDGNAKEIIQKILSDGSIAVNSLEGWSSKVRDTEGIGATMITDAQELSSQVSLSDLKNGTKMILTSNLALISAASGNKTIPIVRENSQYALILYEDMDQMILNWSLDKYK